MKLYSMAVALFVATLMSAAELAAQQTSETVAQVGDHAEAEEPWMYPVEMPETPTINQMNSLIISKGFAETLGVRIFTSTARAIPADVATFEDIVKWYAAKIGATQLSYFLDRFINTGISGPGIGMFKTAQMASSTHLTYRFTREQKQITILHAEETGDVVTISLLGLERETSIQIIRHDPNPKVLAQLDGEPSVER